MSRQSNHGDGARLSRQQGHADESGTNKERSVSDSCHDPTLTVGPASSAAATSTTMATSESGCGDAERAAPAAAFGRYKLEGLIGAGGMGVVYRAYDPMLERPVALKIVRSQDGGEEGQRRLFREAQVLAQVRHPNVVAVHDVGALGEDVFVAMELVEGMPLSQWQKERTPADILRAYLQAGRGLAAAHERGLIHRDVKPGNILVGDNGRVTVIDFGLAAAVNGDSDSDSDSDSDDRAPIAVGSRSLAPVADGSAEENSHSSLRTPLTEVGKIMGTPRYMSPEQHIGGQRVDALSDQYSFSLALYEALTETWPFARNDAGGGTLDALRLAKERAVFATPARAVPTHLRRTLQRALAPEARERFPSMAALLEELEKDPTRARRRQLVALAVVASLAFGAWSAVAGHDEQVALCQGAGEELAKTWNPQRREAVKQAFLASGVHYASDTFERVASAIDTFGKDWTQMRTEACEATHVNGVQSAKVLDLRMGCLDRKRDSLHALIGVFADQPDRQVIDKAVQASLDLGGVSFCADTRALEQEVEPPESAQDRRTLAELRGRLEAVHQLDKLGKYRMAETLLKDVAPKVEALGFGPLQAELAYRAASTLRSLGKYAESEPKYQRAIKLALQWGMREIAVGAATRATFMVGYSLQRHGEGLIYALLAQGLIGDQGGEPEAHLLVNMASIYYVQGHYDKAEELDKRALAIREKALGPEHPFVANSLTNLSDDYYEQGKYAEAEELNHRALAIREKALGPDHPNVAHTFNLLARIYYVQEKYAEAEELHKRAIALREKALGREHPLVAESLHNLADLYRAQKKYQQAEDLDRRTLAIWEESYGLDHPHVARPLLGLAETYEQQRRFADALPLLERAIEIRDKAKVAAKERAQVAFALARVLWAGGLGKDRGRARSLAQEALALYQASGPAANKERIELEQWIGHLP